MISSIEVNNFKCLQEVRVSLDPFTVIVGPNGSGKTAFFEAILLLGSLDESNVSGNQDLSRGTHAFVTKIVDDHAVLSGLSPEIVWHRTPGLKIQVCAKGVDGDTLLLADVIWPQSRLTKYELGASTERKHEELLVSRSPTMKILHENSLGAIRCYRFSPRRLKDSSPLKGASRSLDQDGFGLPVFLNNLLGEHRQAFDALEEEFIHRFGEYSAIRLFTEEASETGKMALGFRLKDGTELSSNSVSDGTVLSLAFMAVCHHPKPPAVLLIEEPENGVHHARLKEIVDTLKAVSEKGVQVIVSTHSPYLLDLVEPEQVRVFWKDEEGAAHAIRMSDAPDVQKMKKDFLTGEIWTIEKEEALYKAATATEGND